MRHVRILNVTPQLFEILLRTATVINQIVKKGLPKDAKIENVTFISEPIRVIELHISSAEYKGEDADKPIDVIFERLKWTNF